MHVHACTRGFNLLALPKRSERYRHRGLGLFFRPKLLLALRQSFGAFFSAQLHLWHSDSPSGAGKIAGGRTSKLTFKWGLILSSGTHQKSQPECQLFRVESWSAKTEIWNTLLSSFAEFDQLSLKTDVYEKRVDPVPKSEGMNQSRGPDLKTLSRIRN